MGQLVELVNNIICIHLSKELLACELELQPKTLPKIKRKISGRILPFLLVQHVKHNRDQNPNQYAYDRQHHLKYLSNKFLHSVSCYPPPVE